MKSNNKFSIRVKWLLGIIIGALILWLIFWPLPDYIEGPGEANNLNSMVEVNHKKSHYQGKLMLTSVGIAPVHPITYLWAKMNPEDSIEKAKAVTGNENDRTYNKVQKFYMRSAINNAIYAAYKNAHQPLRRVYHGIYVLDVMPDSHFRSTVKVGDVITSVNHHHFNSANGYQNYLAHLPHKARVTIQYRHNDRPQEATRRLSRLPYSNRYGIGVALIDDATTKTKIPARVNPRQIGGPSGGLMLALQIYSEIKPVNLTKGRDVAGTGTIDVKGNVGEIGGIDKKIIAAKRNHARIFFAPYIKPTKTLLKYEPNHETNYQLAKRTAHKYAPKMRVVPVKNFWQAVHYLERTK